MQSETDKIIGEQKELADLLGHPGWSIAKRKLQGKIDDLKDAFQVDDSSADAMFRDMQARKAAVQLLEEFLREIEGSKEVATESSTFVRESYVVKFQ